MVAAAPTATRAACAATAATMRAQTRREGDVEGDIVDEAGDKLGTHEGYAAYTVGQRRGLGVASTEPKYVVKTDRQTNQVVLGTRDSLMEDRFYVSEMNWLLPEAPTLPLKCSVQIRHGGAPQPCTVQSQQIEGVDGSWLEVVLEKPLFAIASGQVAAFYTEDTVLGGGWIEKA